MKKETFLRRLIQVFFLLCTISLSAQVTQIKDYDVAGNYTYTVPAGITELVIECWGGGGGGSVAYGLQQSNGGAGAGGGGGAHAHSVIKVTPGQVFTFTIGAGGAGGTSPHNANTKDGKNGGYTSFGNPALIIAEGGSGGIYNAWSNGGSQGGQGGTGGGSLGSVLHIGGSGGDAGPDYSGGGGGGGGRTHSGDNAIGMTAGKSGTCYCGIPGGGGKGLQGVSAVGNKGIDTINIARGVRRSAGGGGGGLDLNWGVQAGGKGADGHVRLKEQVALGPIVGTDYTEVGKTTLLGHPVAGGVWHSSLIEIATVDSTGLVTGISPGEAVIFYSMGSFNTDQSTELHVTVYPAGSSIAIQGARTYCEGGTNQVELDASGPDAATWFWTGPGNFRAGGAHISRPAVAANAGTYTVTATTVTGNNLVVNGDFEAGNSGFISGYTYNQYNLGVDQYNVNNNPLYWSFPQCSDHISETGTYMTIHGSNTANKTIWQQTVTNLEPETDYLLSYWMKPIKGTNMGPILDIKIQAQINDNNVGEVFSAPSTSTCGDWVQFVYNWNSGPATSAQLKLIYPETLAEGYGLSLDDIAFQPIASDEGSIVSANVNIEVGAGFTPEVVIVSHPSPAIANDSVTFIATAVHGGRTPSYKWFTDGVEVAGQTTGVFASEGFAEGTIVTCRLISDISCETSPAEISNGIEIVSGILDLRNYWHGTQSGQWSVIDNWTQRKVPEEGEDIEFATADNYTSVVQRDLEMAASGEVAGYINLTDKKLIVTPGGSLTINGQINTGGENKILIQASATAPAGSLMMSDTTHAPLATVEIWSKARMDNEAAQNNKIKWQYFGIPVTGITASPAFNGAYIRRYNEAEQTSAPGSQWVPLTNTSTLLPFDGYEIAQAVPTKYSISGTLVKSGFSRELAKTEGSYYAGQHILSNPYTAAIDIAKMNFSDGLDKTVYLYNTGSYAEWGNEIVGDEVPGSYIAVPQEQATVMGFEIPSMQGFLVMVSDHTHSTTLSFGYPDVVKKNALQLRSAENKASLAITLGSAHYADKAWLFEEPHCTSGFDNGWDGRKLFGAASLAQVFIAGRDNSYQVSSTDSIDGTCLGFYAGEKDWEYTLRFEGKHLYARYASLYLKDLVTGSTTDLLAPGASYSFRAAPGERMAKRFKIVSDVNVNVDVPDNKDTTDDISVYMKNGTLYLDNRTPEAGRFTVYNLSGHALLLRQPFAANAVTTAPVSFSSGVYLVKMTYGKKVRTVKTILSGH